MEILKEAGTLRRMLPSDLQDVRISVAIVMKRGGVKKKKKKVLLLWFLRRSSLFKYNIMNVGESKAYCMEALAHLPV